MRLPQQMGRPGPRTTTTRCRRARSCRGAARPGDTAADDVGPPRLSAPTSRARFAGGDRPSSPPAPASEFYTATLYFCRSKKIHRWRSWISKIFSTGDFQKPYYELTWDHQNGHGTHGCICSIRVSHFKCPP